MTTKTTRQTMMTDPRIDAAARALCSAMFPEVGANYAWNAQDQAGKEQYTAEASAALAAADAVDPLRQPGHRAEVADGTWTLQHPAECRPNLLACPLNEAMRNLDPACLTDGLWSVEMDDEKELDFTPVVSK